MQPYITCGQCKQKGHPQNRCPNPLTTALLAQLSQQADTPDDFFEATAQRLMNAEDRARAKTAPTKEQAATEESAADLGNMKRSKIRNFWHTFEEKDKSSILAWIYPKKVSYLQKGEENAISRHYRSEDEMELGIRIIDDTEDNDTNNAPEMKRMNNLHREHTIVYQTLSMVRTR